jgi:NSS family neurotransmitter:Na+ symporter
VSADRPAADRWSSRTGFVLATMGSAVGLGSIWKFPYEVGTNGGGAFIAFYLLGLLLIVFPLLLVEFAIGRRGRSDAVTCVVRVARSSRASIRWGVVGILGIAGSVLILSFYAVIGGWAIAYVADTVTEGLPGETPDAVQVRYDALLASPARLTLYQTLFLGLTAVVVARGIARGIERVSLYLMPVLIGLILLLAVYALVEGDAGRALRFLFAVDPDRLSTRSALEAVGLGFFSIGVGLAVMITYAAYAAPEFDLATVAIVTLLSDTAISLMAGLAVFPVVFAEGLDPASGPGLMFVTLPLAFARMPFGALAATAFFLLLSLAALASAMSLLEMPVSLLRQWGGWSRPAATLAAAATCWLLGLPTVLSFNRWSSWYPLAPVPALATSTAFECVDHLASNVLLPLGGFGLAIFGGWIARPDLLVGELGISRATGRAMVRLLRYGVPVAIAAASLAPAILR